MLIEINDKDQQQTDNIWSNILDLESHSKIN